MKIAFACDHGGYIRKEAILSHLQEKGIEVLDFGTDSEESCHYPAFAITAAEAIRDHKADKGIFVCSSGEGVARAANKVTGILAGVGYNDEVSKLLVEHNHAKVITFGAKYRSKEDILRRIDIFLAAEPRRGRHDIRVSRMLDYEKTH